MSQSGVRSRPGESLPAHRHARGVLLPVPAPVVAADSLQTLYASPPGRTVSGVAPDSAHWAFSWEHRHVSEYPTFSYRLSAPQRSVHLLSGAAVTVAQKNE